LPPPAEGQPGPFSLGVPGTLSRLLAEAGFTDVCERVVPAPLWLPTASECVRFERESFGALHQMLGGLDQVEQAHAWDDIEQALKRFEAADGFTGPCELVIAAGRRDD